MFKFKLAKESVPFITTFLILLLVSIIFNNVFFIILFVILLIFILFFFRDPERIVLIDNNTFLSAADGKVVEITEVAINNQKYHKISVFMSIFNVHINRAPYDGVVDEIIHIPGKFRFANRNLPIEDRERNVINIKSHSNRYYLKQIAGFIARRTVFYPKIGGQVFQGQKIGMIKFSSRVEHFIPDLFELTIKKGENVKAGITILAKKNLID
jgi:phosphatidylserine decarboxylase